MHPNDKIFSDLNVLRTTCVNFARHGETRVLTSGCFDLVHGGHLEYLCRAKALASFRGKLVVGINSDEFVRRLKGPNRPVRKEADRAFVMAGFFPVDAVIVFNDDLELIRAVRPDIYVASATSHVRVHDDPPRLALLHELATKIVEVDSGKTDSTSDIIKRSAK